MPKPDSSLDSSLRSSLGMAGGSPGALRGAAAVVTAVAVALGLMLLTRSWLADVMTAGGAGVEQRALAGSHHAAAPVERRPVRVVILDGLSRAEAHGPALDALCATGMDLVIDVGFPTKSLPVQSVLWTGLTAQQSGIAMRNELEVPLLDTLPARVGGARAVVDGWPAIAAASGFAVEHVTPEALARAAATAVACPTAGSEPGAEPVDRDPVPGDRGPMPADRGPMPADRGPMPADRDPEPTDRGPKPADDPERPERGAKRRVEGPPACPPLVLIHVLSIDEVGHRHGRGALYREAAAKADALLAALIARAPDAAWIVVSDHGHLASGGHGDIEDDVRLVRGCVTPRPPGAPPTASVHLVDVSRHLHDTLGVTPASRAVGRPLAVAAAAPDPDATLPRAGRVAWLAAIVVWLASVILAWRFGRPRVAAVAPAVAASLYVVLQGVPSLSSRSPLTALVLGGVIAIASLAAPGRSHPGRVIALTVPVAGVVLAGGILVGMHWALVGGPPPRLPYVTAAWHLAVTFSTVPLLVAVGLVAWRLSDTRTSAERTSIPVRRSGRPDPGR